MSPVNEDGNFLGAFSVQPVYCTAGGSVYNDVSSSSFAGCQQFLSCNTYGMCISPQKYRTCNGGTSSQGETFIGAGGSTTTAGTTNSCGNCVLDPSQNKQCAGLATNSQSSSGGGTGTQNSNSGSADTQATAAIAASQTPRTTTTPQRPASTTTAAAAQNQTSGASVVTTSFFPLLLASLASVILFVCV